ncbi:MAG: biotin-dependent carboxyltransferase family protein, partial [Alphaproteobacteria bacterium]
GLAALEMTLGGGRFRAVGGAVRVALTGARCPAAVDGRPVAWHTAFTLRGGEELAIGKAADGVYAYLHLGGGIAVPEVLHARSTHLRAGFGGLEGREIRVGDVLPAGTAARGDEAVATLDVAPEPPLETVRILWGVHAREFAEAERARFLATTFRVSPKRDRMGVRLEGAAEPFAPARGLTLISDAVVLGDVQVPGDGVPIVLLADRQPTGGYPRIATVITADVPAFAQLPTGAPVRFRAVAPGDAVAALNAHRARLAAFQGHVRVGPAVDPLVTLNLIDGVYEGDSEP